MGEQIGTWSRVSRKRLLKWKYCFYQEGKLKTLEKQLVKITGRNSNACQAYPGLAADKQIAVTADKETSG